MTIESILSLTAEMTAEAMEELIHALAERRQEMLPEVPRGTPQHMLAIDEPDIKMKIEDDGRITFAVRSSALGWLDIRFPISASHATIRACVRASGKVKDDTTVFGPASGNA